MSDSTDKKLQEELFKRLVEKRLFKPYGSTPSTPEALETTKVVVLTYRYHASPQTFIGLLQQFYASKKKGRARLVQSILTEWVRVESQRTLKKAGVIDAILTLLEECAGSLEVNKLKLQLLKRPRRQPTLLEIDGSNFDIMHLVQDHAPRAFAEHMTHIDWEFVSGIEVSEIMFRAWQGEHRHSKAPTLSKLAERFDRVSFWIATSILSQPTEKGVTTVLKFFVRVMAALYSMRNFNSLMMCLSGLNMSVIQRLKPSWASLKSSDIANFNQIDELMSPIANMRRYRDALEDCIEKGEPVIPYVAVYLRDVTYVFDGNADFVGSGKKQEINYEKIELLSVQLGRLKAYQQQKGSSVFTLTSETRDEYVFAIASALPKVEPDEEVLYARSLLAYPPSSVRDELTSQDSESSLLSIRSARSPHGAYAASQGADSVPSTFQTSEEYVTGVLEVKGKKTWRYRWVVLERESKTLSIYPTKAIPQEVNPMTIRTMGSPLKKFFVVDCSIRDGSGITGKPGTISIHEKGDKLRHMLCPTNSIAHAWISELEAYSMITAVEELDVNAFSGAAVVTSDDGIIVGVNQLGLEVFGYREEELIGQNVKILMPNSIANHHDAFLDHYHKHRSRRLIGKARRLKILRKDGRKPEYTIRLGEYMEGETLRYVGVFTQEDPDACGSDLSQFTENMDSEKSVADLTRAIVSMGDSGSDLLVSKVALSLPAHASAVERAAFNEHGNFVCGFLKQKGTAGRWKSIWIVLEHAAKKLSIYPGSKGIKAIASLHEVRPLGNPSKELHVIDCTIRDGSGITGKPGTVSICEKGDHVRHFVCPSSAVALLWIESLRQHSMITAVDTLDMKIFSSPAVASTDHGIIVDANRAAEKLFGYTLEEMEGQNLMMLMPSSIAKNHDTFLAHYRKYKDRRLIGKPRVVNIRRKDGSEPEYIIKLGEYMEGKHLRFVGVFTKGNQSDIDTEAGDSGHSKLGTSSGTVKAASADTWYSELHTKHSETAELDDSRKLTSIEKRAYKSEEDFVSGKLQVKLKRSWKEYFVVLNRSAEHFKLYPAKCSMRYVNLMALRALGPPLKLFHITNCSFRDASGITGKPGSFSLLEKGDHIRYVLCPTPLTAQLWMGELLKYSMIISVDVLDVENFDDPAVAITDHGIIADANWQAIELFGYTEGEMVGQNVSMLMPESVGHHHDGFLAHYRKNQDRRLIGKARPVNIRCKNGSEPLWTIRIGEYLEGKNLRFVGVFTQGDTAQVDDAATDASATWNDYDSDDESFRSRTSEAGL